MNQTTKKHAYDLENRTTLFGESVINLCKELKRDPIIIPLISQIVRSATSVGANYMEANGANSKKEFVYKISLCKKEANETKYWLHMLEVCSNYDKEKIELLSKESHELVLIFQKIVSSSKEV